MEFSAVRDEPNTELETIGGYDEFREEIETIIDNDGMVSKNDLRDFLEASIDKATVDVVLDYLFQDEEMRIDPQTVYQIYMESNDVSTPALPEAFSPVAPHMATNSAVEGPVLSSETQFVKGYGYHSRLGMTSRVGEKVNALYDQVADLREERDELAHQLNDIDHDHDRVEQYEDRIAAMEAHLGTLEAELDQTAEAQHAAEEEGAGLRRTIEDQEKTIDGLRKQLSAALEARTLTEKVATANSEIAKLSAETDYYQHQAEALATLQQDVTDRVRGEIAGLQDATLLVERMHAVIAELEMTRGSWGHGQANMDVRTARTSISSNTGSPMKSATGVFTSIAAGARGRSASMLPSPKHHHNMRELLQSEQRISSAETELNALDGQLASFQKQQQMLLELVQQRGGGKRAGVSWTTVIVGMLVIVAVVLSMRFLPVSVVP